MKNFYNTLFFNNLTKAKEPSFSILMNKTTILNLEVIRNVFIFAENYNPASAGVRWNQQSLAT